MQDSKQIQELALAFAKYIPILAGTAGMKNTRFFTGEVKTVTEDERTCSVEGVMDNETITYNDVNLSMERNDGVIEFPSIGSTVMVAKMPDGETYIVRGSDIDKWLCYIDTDNKLEADVNGFVFNNGNFGGLVKVFDLVNKLNAIESDLNTLKTAFSTWIVVPTDGGAALKAIAATWYGSVITPTVASDLENLKVKH